MNILFLTLVKITSLDERGIYTDLLRAFRDKGDLISIVCPSERRDKKATKLIRTGGVDILRVNTLNIQKTRNTSLINVNKMRMKSATKSINDSKKEKEKELNDLESSDSVPGEDDLATGDGGAGGFAAVMKNSKDSV